MSEFSVQVTGVKELIEKLGKATAQETIEPALFRGAAHLADWSVRNRLSGRISQFVGLNRQSGRLANSITVSRSIDRNALTFFIGTNVKYARIHEFGGIIRAKNAPYLAFKIGEKFIRKKQVVIPARPFLSPAINTDNANIITNHIQKTIDKALSQ